MKALLIGLASVIAIAAGLPTEAAADGSVKLSIADRIGRSIPSLFSITDKEGKVVAGPSESGKPVNIAAGTWLLIPQANPRLSKQITVADGQELAVEVKASDGVWLAFYSGDSRPPQWVMVLPKQPD